MRTLFSHFFNEEYLLPWWLKHHREMFDHGVLFDYHSTDRSRAICKELVPSWEVIPSQNKKFDAIMCDHEIMKAEEKVSGFKMALTSAEFLVCDKLDKIEREIESENLKGVLIKTAVMVDVEPEIEPTYDMPLIQQKHSGFIEENANKKAFKAMMVNGVMRNRLYHRALIGAYTPGRHKTWLAPVKTISADDALIYWYGYSPWNDRFITRKTQIGGQIPLEDLKAERGIQHVRKERELNDAHKALLKYSKQI